MSDKRIYVLRSADEKITKLGVSCNPSSRAETISREKGITYYLVYQSKLLDDRVAFNIESQAKENFKEYLFEGKEWFNIHPLTIIRYFINIVGTPLAKDGMKKLLSFGKFPIWRADNSRYDDIEEKQDNGVKIAADYTAYVQLLFNSRRITIGFANIGDANSFTSYYKHNISSLKQITQLLYNKTFEKWKEEKHKVKEGRNLYKKWLFI